MGRRKTVPVVGIGQFWDALETDYGVAGSYAEAIEEIQDLAPRRLDFHDEFNRTAEDVDVWTSGGDDGSFTFDLAGSLPTAWIIETGNVIDNDRYIHGDAVINNKRFTPYEDGYTTVTWEARLRITPSVVDISAFWGLVQTAFIDYTEPLECLHFFADPAITNTFRARSRRAGEEETDTLVALDTDYHIFRMVWTAASVLFYIDDVLVATHAAQSPVVAQVPEFLIRTEAAAVKGMAIDYVHVEVT